MRRIPAMAALIAVLALIALPGDASATVTNTRITSGPDGVILTDSATFTFASPEGGGFECSLDFSYWRRCSSPKSYTSLPEGWHLFAVRALNRSGHPDPTPVLAIFTVITPPPETTIVSGPTGTMGAGVATFELESNQQGEFQCRLDSQDEAEWIPCGSPHSYSSLADGAHTFEARAVNEAGEVDPTPEVASFTVDATAPETTIDSGPSGTIDVDSASFAFSSSEAGDFQCRLDSSEEAAWRPCSSPRSYSSLAEGPHTFEVRAVDGVGHVDPSPAVASFTVYTGPPKPEAGKTVNLEPLEGTVQLLCPGEDEQSRLTSFRQVPLGCLINTRNGVVGLTASQGSSGTLQDAQFWGGVFIVSQGEGDDQDVELKLAGRRMCERRDASQKPVAKLSRKSRRGRKLWGSGKGNYKTSGSYGSATVRGTTWLVVDRCDSSTLFRVAEGTVWVRDFIKNKTLTIGAGEQYIAKASIPRLDPSLWR